jgi:putative transposase
MYSISRFQELMKLIPRGVLERAVQTHQADKFRKGFSCWQQLIAMIYAQLSNTMSLRTLERGFNSHPAHHYHLDCRGLARSTLADANAKGNPEVFARVAEALMAQAGRRLRAEGAQLLQLLDSTSITLRGRGFDAWTRAPRTRNTQGVKLHLVYGAHEQAPLAQGITPPNCNDIHYAVGLPIESGVRYVFDKGYCDYRWWWRIEQSGASFVTRFKRNARLALIKARPIARAARREILSDAIVQFANQHPRAGRKNPYTRPLRRIEVAREGKSPLVLATNDLRSSARRIATTYRQRWQIELFFKWIKQHLRIKRFFGRSENAVRIQLLTALIAYLLVVLYAKTHGLKQTLWMVLSELRATLFQRPDTERHRHRQWRERRVEFALRQTELFA